MTSPISLYVHFPWCLKRCPYCDFATRKIDFQDIPQETYTEAVLAELAYRLEQENLKNRELKSIFFGGGTPSLWSAHLLGRVLERACDVFGKHTEDVEISVECNPSSLSTSHVQALKAQGVNRLSIGVQSLRDGHLNYLGRWHDGAQALTSIREARHYIDNISADLMFGMPDHSTDELEQDITALVDAGVNHLSAYALTIEPGTQFGALHRKRRLQVASEARYASLFNRARETMSHLGFEHYEVSNYARPSQHSIHNALYWQAEDYLAIGAGAIGSVSNSQGQATRYRNIPEGFAYIKAEPSDCQAEHESLTKTQLLNEAWMLGLRTQQGINLKHAQERTGLDPLASRKAAIERHLDLGHIEVSDSHARILPQYWLHLDSIVLDMFV